MRNRKEAKLYVLQTHSTPFPQRCLSFTSVKVAVLMSRFLQSVFCQKSTRKKSVSLPEKARKKSQLTRCVGHIDNGLCDTRCHLLRFYGLAPGKWCSEDTHCQFCPNNKERCQKRQAKCDPVLLLLYLPHYQLAHETGTEQQYAHNNKIKQRPPHFLCKLHRY
jgi:hypothetical protein